MSSTLGIYSLFDSIQAASPMPTETLAATTLKRSSNSLFRRYILGLHDKTKRCLAEEAENGDEISVLSWIKDGCDPNEYDSYGYTPLLNAAVLGRLNAVEQLIKNNAEINRKGPYGFTALHAAAQNGHRDVVIYLLDNGADINAQNEEGDTPMHLALSTLQMEIVYLLLRKGCNVFIQGFMDKDCIQTARESGLVGLSEYLSQYGACKRQSTCCA